VARLQRPPPPLGRAKKFPAAATQGGRLGAGVFVRLSPQTDFVAEADIAKRGKLPTT
jgi:hypothetical protein